MRAAQAATLFSKLMSKSKAMTCATMIDWVNTITPTSFSLYSDGCIIAQSLKFSHDTQTWVYDQLTNTQPNQFMMGALQRMLDNYEQAYATTVAHHLNSPHERGCL